MKCLDTSHIFELYSFSYCHSKAKNQSFELSVPPTIANSISNCLLFRLIAYFLVISEVHCTVVYGGHEYAEILIRES